MNRFGILLILEVNPEELKKQDKKSHQMNHTVMNTKKFNILATFLITLALSSGSTVYGQKFHPLDENPHDIAYYRPNDDTEPQIKVVYGRIEAEDGVVFGTQVPFGQVWSTGSNESTEVRFYCDVMFGNKYVKAGKYALYTIPEKNYWTVILNSKTDTYGAHFYDSEYDIARIEVPVLKGKEVKNLSIAFDRKQYGSQMILALAKTRVKIPLYTEESLLSKA
jgi:hypothetical protein